jgi:hypothetical protein
VRGLLAAAWVVAACDGGLVVEVIVPEGMAADQVELFVADRDCKVEVDGEFQTCRELTPDTGFRIASDEIYFSDQDGIPPQPADGPGTYVFRLERGKQDTIPLMIAVASTTEGPSGSAILQEWSFSEGPLRLQVNLDEAQNFFGGNDPDVRGVHVWRSGPAACVAVERPSNDVVFLVSSSDPDCDGYLDRDAPAPNTECNPLAWESRVPVPPFGISCLRETEDIECLLGGAACIDGAGVQACAPTDQCVPIENCDGCTNAMDVSECLSQLRTTAPMAAIACDVTGLETAGGLLTCEPGTMEAEVPANLDIELFVGGGRCSEIAFAPPDDPSTYDLSRYQSELEIQTNDVNNLDPAGIITFSVQDQTDRCKFSLRWQAPGPSTVVLQRPYVSTIALHVKDGLRPRIIMLQLQITFGDCAGSPLPGSCIVDGGLASVQSVQRCAQ